LPVYAFKKQNPTWSTSNMTTVPALTYVNPDKFQILHCGLDERWDDDSFAAFARTVPNGRVNDPGDSSANYLLFPAGPFVGDIADTIVNFISETRIEDAPK
jgi:hypothetical protein